MLLRRTLTLTLTRKIRVQKTLSLIRGLLATRVGDQGVEVRHPRGHAGTGTKIRGPHHGDEGTPARGAAILGRPLEVKAMIGFVTPIATTAAAVPTDATGRERVAHPHLSHVHQHGGAGRPQGGTRGETEIGGMIIDDDETLSQLRAFFFYQCTCTGSATSVIFGTMRTVRPVDCFELGFASTTTASTFPACTHWLRPRWIPSFGCGVSVINFRAIRVASSASPTSPPYNRLTDIMHLC